MQRLSLAQYETLTDGAAVLADEFVDGRIRPKVLRLRDRSILKLFRVKRLITSARLFPYAARFQRHADRLRAFGIPTVEVRGLFTIAAIRRTAVHYDPLEGPTLREHCDSHGLDEAQAARLGRFLADLHGRGIYFRSIHFGNLVLTSDHRIGLIDVVDMRFRKGPLGTGRRVRNLRHLFRYAVDIEALAPVRQIFLDAYRAAARLPSDQEQSLVLHFEAYFKR